MRGEPRPGAELGRLADEARRLANWKRWGPYLSERQWGTVREDYSADGQTWADFDHHQARSRAYRWGEDGLLGICDRQGRLCFALALWNGRDPLLKERLFGLTGPEGNHGEDVFSGGFLGLDNIGVFDRSKPLPTGGHIEQADGTAWMAFYAGTMLSMALELAHDDPTYDDLASKFFEHYVAIAHAINTLDGTGLWDEQDGFYYDHLDVCAQLIPLRVRSLVGLIPLIAVEVIEEEAIARLPGFMKRMQWFIENRPQLLREISCLSHCRIDERRSLRLLALPTRERLERMLAYLFDEDEFLSSFGIRSPSKAHRDAPYSFRVQDREYRVSYQLGESDSYLFGGNSNWRGPIWFPLNFLISEALERYHYFYGGSQQVEFPTGSGEQMNLGRIAQLLSQRLVSSFEPDGQGRRPCHGAEPRYADDPDWRELVLFYEYFHGEAGTGLGASHQTGWPALVANLIAKLQRPCRSPTRRLERLRRPWLRRDP